MKSFDATKSKHNVYTIEERESGPQAFGDQKKGNKNMSNIQHPEPKDGGDSKLAKVSLKQSLKVVEKSLDGLSAKHKTR